MECTSKIIKRLQVRGLWDWIIVQGRRYEMRANERGRDGMIAGKGCRSTFAKSKKVGEGESNHQTLVQSDTRKQLRRRGGQHVE